MLAIHAISERKPSIPLSGGLQPNAYTYTLDPLATHFKGGTVAAQLDSDGLTVDWKVSAGNDALALAKEGSTSVLAGDPFGLSMGEFAGVVLGTTVVVGGTVGGYAAAGGFSSSSSPTPTPSPPSSSSM